MDMMISKWNSTMNQLIVCPDINGDVEFLQRALDGGTVTFVSRDFDKHFNRFLVTIGNESRPMNISDQLWRDIGPRS